MKRNVWGFGLRTPKYRTVEWPSLPEYDSVGRWEAVSYEPHEWGNDYPNPAFVRMTDRDAFWAAKIIMRFTPDELQAIVESGAFTDPVEATYFLDVLIARQRKTARHYLNRLNPLDDFTVGAGGLGFANLSERYGFAPPGSIYRVAWSTYDNATGRTQAVGEAREYRESVIPLPRGPGDLTGADRYLLAELHTLHEDHPRWNRRVGVYLRPTTDGFEVVGIERESDPPRIGM